MEEQIETPHLGGAIVDLFAGGGGASLGIRWATGREPDLAANHCMHAIRVHALNHPRTIHLREDVRGIDPAAYLQGQQVDLVWLSPDCTHFSRAKGGAPRSQGIRGLAWVALDWAKARSPRLICLENVPEFEGWGPLDDDGRPIRERAGETFRDFVAALEAEGYAVEWRTLCAADYGAPTTRRRLFLVARRDGRPRWPVPTHGPGRASPWRTAAEVIDWSLPCPSIFDRARPLAEPTQRRIAEGVRRYVLGAARPFVVRVGHHLLAPTLIQTGYGEGPGPLPRALDLRAPLGTVVGGGQKHGLVSAMLARHAPAALPQPPAVRAGEVAAFLMRYYGQGGQWSALQEPLPTVVSRDRFALVTVHVDGEPLVVADIGMRMLQPHELAAAQGFPADYRWEGTKAERVARIGNSVCPQVAAALVAANMEEA